MQLGSFWSDGLRLVVEMVMRPVVIRPVNNTIDSFGGIIIPHPYYIPSDAYLDNLTSP